MTSTTTRALPLLLAALCATGPLGIDMYLASIPDMARSLATSEGNVQLSLMTFFAGLMLGQLVYGPLSDKLGRKPIITAGLSIFILGSVGCALASTIQQLHALRLLQGLGGSIGMVMAFAIAKDLYNGAALGKMISMILAVLGLSPVLAPMLGNCLQELGSWRSIFWLLAGYASLVLIACNLLLPETRNLTERQGIVLRRVLHTYGQIAVDGRFMPFALALCIAQAGFFAYIAGSASVLISEHGLSPTQFSLLFGVNALGLVAAAILNPTLQQRLGPLSAYRRLNAAYVAMLAALFAYLACGYTSLWILSVGLFVTVTLLGFIMPTGSQLALMQQREHSGSASALMGAMQFGAGALIAAASGALVHWGDLGLVALMLACAAVSGLICLIAFPRRLQL